MQEPNSDTNKGYNNIIMKASLTYFCPKIDRFTDDFNLVKVCKAIYI